MQTVVRIVRFVIKAPYSHTVQTSIWLYIIHYATLKKIELTAENLRIQHRLLKMGWVIVINWFLSSFFQDVPMYIHIRNPKFSAISNHFQRPTTTLCPLYRCTEMIYFWITPVRYEVSFNEVSRYDKQSVTGFLCSSLTFPFLKVDTRNDKTDG